MKFEVRMQDSGCFWEAVVFKEGGSIRHMGAEGRTEHDALMLLCEKLSAQQDKVLAMSAAVRDELERRSDGYSQNS